MWEIKVGYIGEDDFAISNTTGDSGPEKGKHLKPGSLFKASQSLASSYPQAI